MSEERKGQESQIPRVTDQELQAQRWAFVDDLSRKREALKNEKEIAGLLVLQVQPEHEETVETLGKLRERRPGPQATPEEIDDWRTEEYQAVIQYLRFAAFERAFFLSKFRPFAYQNFLVDVEDIFSYIPEDDLEEWGYPALHDFYVEVGRRYDLLPRSFGVEQERTH